MTEGDNPTIRRGQWERLVRGWPIPKREKAVALGAGTYANADGTKVKPSVKTLAQSTGYSTRSVKYALRNLREWRFLTVAVESRWVQGQPGSAPREYRLTAPNRLPSELGLGAWCNPLHGDPTGHGANDDRAWCKPRPGMVQPVAPNSPKTEPETERYLGLSSIPPSGQGVDAHTPILRLADLLHPDLYRLRWAA